MDDSQATRVTTAEAGQDTFFSSSMVLHSKIQKFIPVNETKLIPKVNQQSSPTALGGVLHTSVRNLIK